MHSHPRILRVCLYFRVASDVRDSTLNVTLFSAPGCQLCEEARAILAQCIVPRPLSVTEVNIRSSSELERELGLRIPVARFPNETELNWPFSAYDVEIFAKRCIDAHG
jgi:hypothetical protein